jgi:carbamoyl-phosphate synthase large subunit
MEIVDNHTQLDRYINEAVIVSGDSPVLIDGYLRDAIEVDVDALSDGKDVYIAGIMEHIEEAGVHSGDSACSLPPYSLNDEILEELNVQTKKLAKALNVVGLMNVQYAVKDNEIYIIEVNPRASRTVPFVAKVIGHPIASIASELMAGASLEKFNLSERKLDHIAVKEAVFPFNRFPGVDSVLGPEMRSTGEVMGLDRDFAMAFAKAQMGVGIKLPSSGTVFVSVKERDKERILEPVKSLEEMGFTIIATSGTARYLNDNGIEASQINKVLEGRPHIVDHIKNRNVDIIFNTTEGAKAIKDSKSIRQAALMHQVPVYTTMAGIRSVAKAIKAISDGNITVTPIQDYMVSET